MFSDLLYALCLNTCPASPIFNVWDHSGMYVTTDEPTWMQPYHPKSIYYITLELTLGVVPHSWFLKVYSSVHIFSQISIMNKKNTKNHLVNLGLNNFY